MRTADDLHPLPIRPRRRSTHRIVRAIGILGRVFVGAGLILLFYTAYLLWGTGVYTKQEQQRAADQLARNPLVTEQRLEGGKIPPARPPGRAELGAPLFTLKIPKIGLETVVVQGVGREELKKGPGHFPDCNNNPGTSECVSDAKYPGESGNVPVSGHRTTYGAPFFRLNELEKGDVIDFVSGRARYRYKVRETKIVDPIAGFREVEQHGRDEVTLTTCHPRFTAAQRMVIQGDYIGASLVSAPRPVKGKGGAEVRTARQPVVPTDVLVLASIAGASALGALGLSKRYRMGAVYISLVIVGAAGLWIGIFPRVLALMPANY
jgi:sortase A